MKIQILFDYNYNYSNLKLNVPSFFFLSCLRAAFKPSTADFLACLYLSSLRKTADRLEHTSTFLMSTYIQIYKFENIKMKS